MARPFVHRSISYRLRARLRRLWYGTLGLGRTSLRVEGTEVSTTDFLGRPLVDFVVEAVERHGETARKLFVDSVYWGGGVIGSYDLLESCVLMEVVRSLAPRRIVEMAPNRGYSTALIQLALVGRDDFEHRSYDIGDYREDIEYTVGRFGLLRNWAFFQGDYRQLLSQGDHGDFLDQTDLFFIDADHSRAFGMWYVKEARLFDRLHPGAVVHIHDMYPPGTRGRELNPEGDPVFDWIDEHRDRLEILWNHEAALSAALHERLPRWVFHDHQGGQAANPSLWFQLPGPRSL